MLAHRLDQVSEAVGQAVVAIWSNKLRSGLTILGVVIGVSTVMAMASIVNGFRAQIVNTLEVVGPSTFRILRYFSTTPVDPQNPPREVRIRPALRQEEAQAIARLPEIYYAEVWVQVFQRMEFGATRTQLSVVFGADDRFMEVLGGTMVRGRSFTEAEQRSGAGVVVLEAAAAERVFGQMDPLGTTMRIGGRPLRVIGIFRQADNIFQPRGQETAAILPYETVHRSFRYDDVNALIIIATPREGVPVDVAMDAATVQLRLMRGLRPGDPDTWDMLTSDEVLAIFDRLTSAFFGVMIALSSVALMVGGIGVMAIMMISVTDRTREIGVRKALGATRREILWQFLIEASTLTLLGGLLGVGFGLLAGEGLKAVLGFSAGVPVWSAVIATLFSVAIGVIFGFLPARRAAGLDPIEALRYE
jgi:putative ABC transport system permease protein